MNWTNLFAAGRSVVGLGGKPAYRAADRGSLPKFDAAPPRADAGLFAVPEAAPVLGEPKADGSGVLSTSAPKPATRALPVKRSWFGWLFGGNRRREGGRLVQGELLLQNVRPLRNHLRGDDVALVERRPSKLLWETPMPGVPRDDQGHAWNRLRGRQLDRLVVKPD